MNSYGRPFICTENKCRFLTKMMQMKLGHNCVSFVILRRGGADSQSAEESREKEGREEPKETRCGREDEGGNKGRRRH